MNAVGLSEALVKYSTPCPWLPCPQLPCPLSRSTAHLALSYHRSYHALSYHALLDACVKYSKHKIEIKMAQHLVSRCVFCIESQHLWCWGPQPKHVSDPDSVANTFEPHSIILRLISTPWVHILWYGIPCGDIYMSTFNEYNIYPRF